MLAWILSLLLPFLMVGGAPATSAVVTIPATSQSMTEAEEWDAYHAEAVSEYSAEFTALYRGYETKWSKNGRLMIRTGDSGPYKFVKRAV